MVFCLPYIIAMPRESKYKRGIRCLLIIQTIVKIWNKSKESLMPRSKTKQVRVSPKVPPNNQECIDVYQCSVQRVYN
jgi:hypothetical protein